MSLEVVRSRELLSPETDLLVVLGKNLGAGWTAEDVQKSPDHLSVDSCINILAAGELYMPGMHILLSGGRTIGEGLESQPVAARKYLHKKYPYIPEDDVSIEETGFDTRASAEAVAFIARVHKYKHVGLLSVGYHVKNAATLFKRWDAPLETIIASEDIVAERSKYHEDYIVAWRGLGRVSGIKGEKNREKVRTVALATVDRKGRLLRRLTSGRVDHSRVSLASNI